MLNEFYKSPHIFVDFNHNVDVVNKPIFSQNHFHYRYEIYYFISGNAKYFIDDKTYILNPGNLLMINDSQLHRVILQPDEDYERITIHFNHNLIRNVTHPDLNLIKCFEEKDKNKGDLLDLSHDPDFSDAIFSLKEKFATDTPENITLRLTGLIDLLTLIKRHYEGDNFIEPIESSSRIKPVLDYINSHLSQPITLELLEQKFYINKYYLSRLFKRSTTYTFHEYITYKRMLLAKELINKGMSFSEVAERVGYNSYSCFFRSFKQLTGMSPSEYVNSLGKYNY